MGLVTVFWPATTTTGGEFEFQADGEARFVVSIIEVIWLMRLRRAEAVEAGGIIARLRITERGRAAAVQEVGGHRQPDGMGQVRAGFHHDDRVAGAGDVKAKMAAGDAQRAGLRIPQLSRSTAKKWAPARGAGKIIDDETNAVI